MLNSPTHVGRDAHNRRSPVTFARVRAFPGSGFVGDNVGGFGNERSVR